MSATTHDALPDFSGKLLKIDPTASDVQDPTEDLADEITSELGTKLVRPVSAALVDQRGEAQDAGPPAIRGSGERVLRERYVLEAPLGNGGMATVYRALDLRRDPNSSDGHRVAIKLLRPEQSGQSRAIARLQREFRQAQVVAHPNVVRVHDLDCDHGTWFIVMEHLAGETLGPRLRRAAPAGLPQAEALGIGCAVGEALAHAHARGVTHGDVKPDNVYLTTAGEVRLLDFGAAPEPGLPTASGNGTAPRPDAAATRVYASPDVLAGAVPEPRDDVFSFACVVHEMLAGSHPYGRRGADLALQQGLEPAPIESLDSEPRHALLAALDLKRAARPAMAELVRALHGKAEAPAAVVPAAADAAIPVAAVPTAASGIGQSRLAIGSAIVAGLALVLGILIGRQDAGPEREVAKTQPTQRAVAVPPAPEPAPVAIVAAKAMAPDPEEANAEPPDPAAGLPSLVSFDAAAMTVSGRAVVAAIPLRHLSRVRRAVDVRWRLLDGSARAGQDYGGPTTGVESFIEGHSFRILYVPILAATPPTRDRSFAVELTEVSGGASLGPTERIEVTILGSY